MVCVNLTHCIFGQLRSPARTTADQQGCAVVPKPSEAPQFGPILRAPIQWVKKAFKQWWMSVSSRTRTGNYSIRGHKRVCQDRSGPSGLCILTSTSRWRAVNRSSKIDPEDAEEERLMYEAEELAVPEEDNGQNTVEEFLDRSGE